MLRSKTVGIKQAVTLISTEIPENIVKYIQKRHSKLFLRIFTSHKRKR